MTLDTDLCEDNAHKDRCLAGVPQFPVRGVMKGLGGYRFSGFAVLIPRVCLFC